MKVKLVTVREAADFLRISTERLNDTWLKEEYRTPSQPVEY